MNHQVLSEFIFDVQADFVAPYGTAAARRPSSALAASVLALCTREFQGFLDSNGVEALPMGTLVHRCMTSFEGVGDVRVTGWVERLGGDVVTLRAVGHAEGAEAFDCSLVYRLRDRTFASAAPVPRRQQADRPSHLRPPILRPSLARQASQGSHDVAMRVPKREAAARAAACSGDAQGGGS